MNERRRKSVDQLFKERHGGRAPDDVERVLLKFTLDISELYDQNFNELKRLNAEIREKGAHFQDAETMRALRTTKKKQQFHESRETKLQKVNVAVRDALILTLKDPNPEEK
jgi:Skp family chaperone for outer membrane proteins